MAIKLLQVNFKYNVSTEDYKGAVSPLAGLYAAVEGLKWKVWIVDDNGKEAGGILLFENEQVLDAFMNGPRVAELTSHPALSDFSVKIFDVMTSESRITRAPID